MIHDGILKISVGASRFAPVWTNVEMPWSELVARLSNVIRTRETMEEWDSCTPDQQGALKDVGGFVGGTLLDGLRKAPNVLDRSVLTLDLDNIPQNVDPWYTICLVLGYASALYSTHSHRDDKTRLRLVFPLSRPVSPYEYEALSRLIAYDVGIDLCDDSTYQPSRLMYWPSASQDAPFRFEHNEGEWLNVDTHLARYSDWQDSGQWPRSSRQMQLPQKKLGQQEDPHAKTGVVGAFCRTYTIEDVIFIFLTDKYIPCGGGRFTYVEGSTFGGLVVYEDGKFAYSHHGTDPACEKLCNAFDLVRIHLFGHEDEGIAPNTKAGNFPSFQKMTELAMTVPQVSEALALELNEDLVEMFKDGYVDENSTPEEMREKLKWFYEDLERHPKTNVILSTINNVMIILANDPRMSQSYFFDEFKGRAMVEGDLPWKSFSDRTTLQWTDLDDAGLRCCLESEYKIDHVSKVKDGIDLALQGRKRHPVRDYLNEVVWDGIPRVEQLLIDYLGAEDSEYVKTVTRKALLGAVMRIMRPGVKHDQVLVLVGPQGCGKSTLLAKLGMQWFSDSLYTLSGKEAYELLEGHWIIEIAEMAATKKSEEEQFKAFISKTEDTYRAAYARRPETHPRQCAFFGTTNTFDFLRDVTGGRRMWPVNVKRHEKGKRKSLTQDVVDQVWGEIMTYYRNKEVWYLPDELEEVALQVQKAHTESSGKQGLVEKFLEKELPLDWNNRTLEQRRAFWDPMLREGMEKDIALQPRQRVCCLEIWQELFEGNTKHYGNAQAREINNILKQIEGWQASPRVNCGEPYGRQRGYVRIVT